MTIAPDRDTDTTALAASLLEEEARREADASQAEQELVLDDSELLGVGGDEMPLRTVLRRGGTATIGVLFGLNLVDEFDRTAFAVLGPDIQRSLHVSDAVLALIGGIGAVAVMVAAVPLGMLADRVRRTWLIAMTSTLWAAFALAVGMVTSAWQLGAARIVNGLGKGNEPAVKSLLCDTYPLEGRARIFSVHTLANPIGSALGPLLAGAVAAIVGGTAGWRWAFVVLSLPCLLLAVAALFLREPERGSNERTQMAERAHEPVADAVSDPIPMSAAFERVSRIRSFKACMSGMAALGFAVAGIPTIYNLVLERQFHLGAFDRGLVNTIEGLGAIVGIVLFGRATDRIFQRDPAQLLRLVCYGLAATGVLYPLGLFMPHVALLVAVHFIAGMFISPPIAVLGAVLAAVVPYRMRAFSFSMIAIWFVMVGGLFGGIAAGLLSDAVGGRNALAILLPVAFAASGAYMYAASTHVKHDMSLVVEELKEEREEALRAATAGASDDILQVRNLDFSYGPVQVLFGVDLELRRGETLALLGTNGAGKSTVLRALSGLALPERGVVRFNGRNVTFTDPTERVRRGIVQVPGGKAVFPTLTVRENLLVGAHTFLWDSARMERKAEEVLDLFPRLRERLDQAAGTLSGGEQQMLALAKALLLDPELLLIDELSLGLAPVAVQEILRTVDTLKERGISMIIVEQSLNVALSIADRAVFMEKGRVRFEGPAAELLERDDLARAVFLGGEGG